MKAILKHNKSGLKYIINHVENDIWYLSCNDGIVPSGQRVYGNTAEEIAKEIDCVVVG